MNKLTRHGDVMLKPVTKKQGKLIHQSSSYVVAEGKSTGHRHTLSTATKNGIRVFQDEAGVRYLDITGNARIRHKEHKELEVEPGIYQVVIEREHDYFLGEMRRVVD